MIPSGGIYVDHGLAETKRGRQGRRVVLAARRTGDTFWKNPTVQRIATTTDDGAAAASS